MADFISALLMCRKIPRQKKIGALRGCDADVQGIVLTSLRDDAIGKQRLCQFDGLVRDGQAWNSGHKILAPFAAPSSPRPISSSTSAEMRSSKRWRSSRHHS